MPLFLAEGKAWGPVVIFPRKCYKTKSDENGNPVTVHSFIPPDTHGFKWKDISSVDTDIFKAGASKFLEETADPNPTNAFSHLLTALVQICCLNL